MNRLTVRTLVAAALGAALACAGVVAVHAATATSSSQFAACTDKLTHALYVAGSDGSCPDGQTQVTWFGHLDPKVAARLDADLAANAKQLAQAKTQLAHLKAELAAGHKKHTALQSKYSAATSTSAKIKVLDELDEQTSAELQASMDKLSGLWTTLSNILKKVQDTANGITQNIK